MKLDFLPANLHLYTDERGFACSVFKGEVIGRFRSHKEGVRKFNELRLQLEKDYRGSELTEEERRAALLREIGDSLIRHNALRNSGPKKRTGTRTFG